MLTFSASCLILPRIWVRVSRVWIVSDIDLTTFRDLNIASETLRDSAIVKILPLTKFEVEVTFTDSIKIRPRFCALFDSDVIFNDSFTFLFIPFILLLNDVIPTVSDTERATFLAVPLNDCIDNGSDTFLTILSVLNLSSNIDIDSVIVFIIPFIFTVDDVTLTCSETNLNKASIFSLASVIPSISLIITFKF